MHSAYLIAICNPLTNALIRAEIWSSPEWHQSMQLPERTYVAFEVKGTSFHEAHKSMLRVIARSDSRYHYLFGLLDEATRSEAA